MVNNEGGIVAVYNPELESVLPPNLETADRLVAGLFRSYDEYADALPAVMQLLGRPAEPEAEAEGVVTVGDSGYQIDRPARPQAARCLAMYGALKVKAALSTPESGERQQKLAEAKHALHAGRQLLAPFIASEPGYLLSAISRGEGNPVQRHMTVGRRQRHELINGPFANILSMLGRIAMAEGDTEGTARLGTAHDVYLGGSDKAGQTRNIMYMMLCERSQGLRIGRLGWNALRLSGALATATLRRQFGAWRVAGKMGGRLLRRGAAREALEDYRMI